MEDRDEAFRMLYQCNAGRMLRYAAYQLRSKETAEELVDEAFVLLLRKYDTLTGHPNLAGWLWRTLQHLILTEVRSARRRMEVPMEGDWDLAAPEEHRETLADALPEGLSEKEQEILRLFYEEELSHEEIAQRMGISVLNSRTRLFRARNRCKELWEEEKKSMSFL